MDPGLIVLAAAAGYLAGAVSFARIVTRQAAPGQAPAVVEIPVEGLDETFKLSAVSASNAGLTLGRRVGCLIGLLDMLKVTLPTLAFRLAFPTQYYYLIAAAAGVAGHNWPVYYGFKGGRGISAVFGGMFAIDWLGALVVPTVGMALGMGVVRDFLIAYLAGLWLLIPWMIVVHPGWPHLAYALGVNLLFMLAMIPELKQVIALRRKLGGKGDMKAMLEYSPMGQAMRDLSKRFKAEK